MAFSFWTSSSTEHLYAALQSSKGSSWKEGDGAIHWMNIGSMGFFFFCWGFLSGFDSKHAEICQDFLFHCQCVSVFQSLPYDPCDFESDH